MSRRGLLGVLALAAAALLAMAVRRGARPEAGSSDAGPVLVVRRLEVGGAALPPPEPDDEERAMALASVVMGEAERKRVLESIDFAATRLEARLSPLGTDFGDDDPIAQLRAFIAPYVPSFTAARELERGRWSSRDLAVRVAASCALARPTPDERCIVVRTAEAGSSDDRRARLLGWTASHAKRVELGTREAALACARHLRSGALKESSPIALVLLGDDLTLRPSPEQAELRAATRRLGRALWANQLETPKELEAFAHVPPEARIVPWLTVSPSQVVVVPRLSALSRDLAIDCPASRVSPL